MDQYACKVAVSPRELRAHFRIRHEVFVKEQGVFETSDVDENDRRALPIVAWRTDENRIVGAVRCYRDHSDTWYGGRLAVRQNHRCLTVGANLVRTAERVVLDRGCKVFLAHIQVDNVPFFKYLDWEPIGEREMHHGLEHQMMRTEWSESTEAYPREQSA
ncbi:MAG: MSMEG_0567/Sll0786 family nitrogen starvation N-acetyltransferase [bacterium]